MKFKVGDEVVHKATGGTYVIEATPNDFQIKFQEIWYPSYRYSFAGDDESYARTQQDMEEKFEKALGEKNV